MRRLLRSIGLFLFEDYVNWQVENRFGYLERKVLEKQQVEYERRRQEEQLKYLYDSIARTTRFAPMSPDIKKEGQ